MSLSVCNLGSVAGASELSCTSAVMTGSPPSLASSSMSSFLRSKLNFGDIVWQNSNVRPRSTSSVFVLLISQEEHLIQRRIGIVRGVFSSLDVISTNAYMPIDDPDIGEDG